MASLGLPHSMVVLGQWLVSKGKKKKLPVFIKEAQTGIVSHLPYSIYENKSQEYSMRKGNRFYFLMGEVLCLDCERKEDSSHLCRLSATGAYLPFFKSVSKDSLPMALHALLAPNIL